MAARLHIAAALLAPGLILAQAAVAVAQSCPEPLAGATRLAMVTAAGMNATSATLQQFERAAPSEPWRAVSQPEPAVVGRAGMAWAQSYRRLARPGEPLKVEGDKRAPAGVYALGRPFGTLPSGRSDYLRVTPDTVCVDDAAHPAYNRITSRRSVGPKVSVENMSRALPMYRRGIVVDYPTDARARAGSCIFVHVWKSPGTGTAGCVALPEPRVEALIDFASPGAAIAILPRPALRRLRGCLPGAS